MSQAMSKPTNSDISKKVIDESVKKILKKTIDKKVDESVNNYMEDSSKQPSESTKKLEVVKSSTPTAQPAIGENSPQPNTPGKNKSNFLPNMLGKGLDVLSNVPDAAKYQQNETYQQTGSSSEAAPIAEETAKSLPSKYEGAVQGIRNAADITQNLGTPVAERATQSSEDVAADSKVMAEKFKTEYENATKLVNQSTTDYGKMVEDAAKNSKIEPNRYYKELGVSGQLLTSIGMVLSGIGSGLTGQPNLAAQIFQKNVDRDIQAQQQTYQNLMENAAKQRDMILTAKDRQIIAADAYFKAKYAVLAGAKAAVENVSDQTKFASAKEAAKRLELGLSQDMLNVLGSYASFYQTVHAAGDLRNFNILGVGTTALIDKLGGTNLGYNRMNPRERLTLFSGDSPDNGQSNVQEPSKGIIQEEPKKEEKKSEGFYQKYQNYLKTVPNQ